MFLRLQIESLKISTSTSKHTSTELAQRIAEVSKCSYIQTRVRVEVVFQSQDTPRTVAQWKGFWGGCCWSDLGDQRHYGLLLWPDGSGNVSDLLLQESFHCSQSFWVLLHACRVAAASLPLPFISLFLGLFLGFSFVRPYSTFLFCTFPRFFSTFSYSAPLSFCFICSFRFVLQCFCSTFSSFVRLCPLPVFSTYPRLGPSLLFSIFLSLFSSTLLCLWLLYSSLYTFDSFPLFFSAFLCYSLHCRNRVCPGRIFS